MTGRPTRATIRAEQQDMLAAKLGKMCSHGVAWSDDCPECNLVSARETVRHHGQQVDEARALIAEMEGEVNP